VTSTELQIDASDRGRLAIHDRVIVAVARRAVRQVADAGSPPRRLLGVTFASAPTDGDVRVAADVDGGTVTVAVTLTVHWPASVPAIAGRVRDQIRADVARITGTTVRRIDVDVVSLATAADDEPRVR
jgi:uncharacterized alkaline shock family protein YloU